MIRRSLVILALAAFATTSTLFAANASIGNWKYNPAKSKFSPGPPYKSRTVKVEAHGEGIKVTVDGVSGDGSKHGYTYTANFDGKDNPVAAVRRSTRLLTKRLTTTPTKEQARRQARSFRM